MKLSKLIIAGIAACSVQLAFGADPSLYWPRGYQFTGHVSSFGDAYANKNNLARVDLPLSIIPEQYRSDTRNCRDYLYKDVDTEWISLAVVCDYQQDKEVKIYFKSTVNNKPLNIGDEVTVTVDNKTAVAGYFSKFVQNRGDFEKALEAVK